MGVGLEPVQDHFGECDGDQSRNHTDRGIPRQIDEDRRECTKALNLQPACQIGGENPQNLDFCQYDRKAVERDLIHQQEKQAESERQHKRVDKLRKDNLCSGEPSADGGDHGAGF